MITTRILKSLLIAALLSCTSAHAADAVGFALEDGKTAAPLRVSDLRCKLVEAQIRCTFGS